MYTYKANKKYNYFKSGKYLFMMKAITPFAWSNDNQEKNDPISYIYINIK